MSYIPYMPNWVKRMRFWLAYMRKRTPWDTNVTPPELVMTVAGPKGLSPGRALDLGCGTGTNVIFLAQHGWTVVGVDFVDTAIWAARHKADSAGVDVAFFVGDVTQLHKIKGLHGNFDLVLDIGCFHSLEPEGRSAYVTGLLDRLRPGATYLLYAQSPRCEEADVGVSLPQVADYFSPYLHMQDIRVGEEWGRPSAWYWFRSPSEKK
jgi:cyclopropane fatty-acyl-phospholipid synthase-like methyltransferase